MIPSFHLWINGATRFLSSFPRLLPLFPLYAPSYLESSPTAFRHRTPNTGRRWYTREHRVSNKQITNQPPSSSTILQSSPPIHTILTLHTYHYTPISSHTNPNRTPPTLTLTAHHRTLTLIAHNPH